MGHLSDISLYQLSLSILMALLPVLIWLNIFFKNDKASQKPLLKSFLFGVFSVVPLMAIQYLWLLHPEFDVYQLAGSSDNVALGFLGTFVAIGVFEEFTKFNMLRHLKWAGVEIRSVNDAMRYIFAIALGFAFTENIFYFYSLSSSSQVANLIAAFGFRSTFTTAAHMVFSGIVGYYYAIGKFGNPVLELDRWTGEKHGVLNLFQKTFGLKDYNLFRFQKTMQGLTFAMLLHALFNFSLQFNRMDYATAIVAVGFVLVVYLNQRRTTYLVFKEAELARPSTIGKAEERVVIELMGMWMREGKYKEVIEICGRLSQRDPDNNVVKLFRAKATDRRKMERVKKAIHLLFTDEDYDADKEELSLFERLKRTQDLKKSLSREEVEHLSLEDVKKALVNQAVDDTLKRATEELGHQAVLK